MNGMRGSLWGIAGLCAVTFMTSASARQSAAPADSGEGSGVRLKSTLVTLDVTVQTEQGRFVAGVERGQFRVFDNDVPQTVSFYSGTDAPITVGIVCDVSGSMKVKIGRAVVALERFMQTCHPEDEYFLVGFGDRAELLTDFTESQGFADRLKYLTTGGETALYDAVVLGLEKAQEGRHTRRALLIVSDGQDNHSRYTMAELREMAKEADVAIYAIGIYEPTDELAPYGAQVLDQICKSTGGRALFPKNVGQLMDCCSIIAIELRHQYTLGFYPNGEDSQRRWHKIKVKLDAPADWPRLAVRARPGYYGGAPAATASAR